MLTPITPPTTSNLMAPETVLARLKLPESELDELTEQVAEASGLVARYLGFRPEFATWQETFTGVNGDRLYLGARPAWAVTSVTYRGEATPMDEASYRLDRGPHGESSVIRSGLPWGIYGSGPFFDPWISPVLSTSPFVPDWTVQYEAGWWLEEMTGVPPAGVLLLPAEIKRDFLKIVRWLRQTQSHNANVRAMWDDGAKVEFFEKSEQDIDPQTGIPNSCTISLSLYRRAV